MIKTKHLGAALLLAMIALCVGVFLFSGPAISFAKSVFGVGKASAVATTTLQYLTPGTGTTTIYYDAFTDGQTAADGMALLVRFTASSSPNSVLRINQEYSQGSLSNPNLLCIPTTATTSQCDWYQAPQPMLIANATTTSPVDISQVAQYNWRFASSSAGLGSVAANNNTDTRIIPIKSPTRYTRFIFTLPAGSANGAVWVQIVPLKQNP